MTSFGELPQTESSSSSKRKAVVLTADKFEDMEVYVPVFRLLEAGWHVDIAAPTMDTIHGKNGYILQPTKTINEVNADEYNLHLPR